MTVLMREVIGDVLRRPVPDQGRTLREVSDSVPGEPGYLSEGRTRPQGTVERAARRHLRRPGHPAVAGADRRRWPTGLPQPVGQKQAAPSNIDVITKVVIPPVTAMAVAWKSLSPARTRCASGGGPITLGWRYVPRTDKTDINRTSTT